MTTTSCQQTMPRATLQGTKASGHQKTTERQHKNHRTKQRRTQHTAAGKLEPGIQRTRSTSSTTCYMDL